MPHYLQIIATTYYRSRQILKAQILNIPSTDDEAFKSICRVLGPLTKKPTLGVQRAVEAGYLFKEHASISAWLFTFLS